MWNNIPQYKREGAIKRVKTKLNNEIQGKITDDYKKGFMNEKFNKIMELKLKWELGEISKDVFMKFTKNHVLDCWAFKYMNVKKELSARKIQKCWKNYTNKKFIIIEIHNNYSPSYSDYESDSDPLEKTIYNWKGWDKS